MKLRVMTYNIQHAMEHAAWMKDKTEIINFDMVADVIKRFNPDVVGLNEVRGRGTNTEEDIQNRLLRSREELKELPKYDYVIINEDGKSQEAAQRLCEIVHHERYRVANNPHIYQKFFGIEENSEL